MKEQELLRAVNKIVEDKTHRYDTVLEEIWKRFEKIEQKIAEELNYPNARRKYVLEEIRKLSKIIGNFLDREKNGGTIDGQK